MYNVEIIIDFECKEMSAKITINKTRIRIGMEMKIKKNPYFSNIIKNEFFNLIIVLKSYH